MLVIAALSTAVVTVATAQSVVTKMGGGGSVYGTGGNVGTTGKTVLEDFADKLKLDDKTQIPSAERLFTAATVAAAPVAADMKQQRRAMLDAELAGKPVDFKVALDAYTDAASRMA